MSFVMYCMLCFFFFQAEDGIRDKLVTGVQTCALPISDLLFVASRRSSIITRRAVEGPPDLIVEVLSTKTSKRDRETKLKLYARYGVSHYWIIHPDERWIEFYENEPGAYRLAARKEGYAVADTSFFPELEIRLRDV